MVLVVIEVLMQMQCQVLAGTRAMRRACKVSVGSRGRISVFTQSFDEALQPNGTEVEKEVQGALDSQE
jgi:hypothetical protein